MGCRFQRPAREKFARKCPTAGERWLLPVRAAHRVEAVPMLGSVAAAAVSTCRQLQSTHREETRREH
jgi:hypothetical protein